jgi:hypothetical protein
MFGRIEQAVQTVTTEEKGQGQGCGDREIEREAVGER